jgi:hypothetical protein
VLVVVAGALVLALVAAITVALVRAGGQPSPAAGGSPTKPSAGGGRDGTYDELIATLNAHGQALVRNDRRGWLAAVDPRQAGTVIAECDHKLRRYRAALEAGADPTVVAAWIAAATSERGHAQAELDRHGKRRPATHRLTRDQIAALVATVGDALAVLRDADPADKAEVYRQLGLRLTYHPEHER